jgi:hypothetical protein
MLSIINVMIQAVVKGNYPLKLSDNLLQVISDTYNK